MTIFMTYILQLHRRAIMSDSIYSTLNTLVDQLITQNNTLKHEKNELAAQLRSARDEIETLQLELMEVEENQQSQTADLNALVSKLQQVANQ